LRATRLLVAVVLVLLVLGVLAAALVSRQQSADEAPGGLSAPPAASPTPSVVAGLPPLLPPLADLEGSDAGPPPPTAEGLARVLDPLLTDPALGPRVSAAVVDGVTGERLYAVATTPEPLLPASTSKIVTAAAALTELGAHQRFSTRVVTGAAGEVVLVGGGDPTLASPAVESSVQYGGTPPARLSALADVTASRLLARGATGVPRLVVDSRLFGGPELAPGWRPTYLTEGSVARVTALQVDTGRVAPRRGAREAEPDLAAGQRFAALLAERGLPVGVVERGAAPPDAEQIARAQSPPVAGLVEVMLAASDNDIAEALARHVALARGEPATFAGAATALRASVVDLGLDPQALVVADGSGLSRDSRIRPEAVAQLLALAGRIDRPELRPVLGGLPVGGYEGTIERRFRARPDLGGAVRAKTGTLSDVSTLAGLVLDAEGRLLAFGVGADAVPTGIRPAEAVLDRIAVALADCGCS
jgi:serine-type D-Ala-D-Ala carboxypeptidase/endopeptidase (penicillin-binding protein 4)